MGILLFIFSFLFYWFISLFLPKNDSYSRWYLGASCILAIITTIIGTGKGCQDNWLSPSIGIRGACSHHGGVTTRLNDFGIGFLIFLGIIILIFVLYTQIQEYINKRKNANVNTMTFINNTLTNSRVFPYTSETIFSRYSDANSLTRWWGPHGNTNIFESFDFKEGGKWKFIMNDGKNDHPNEWIFRKIEKNHILMEHTVAPYFTLEVTLEELENNTTKMSWFSTWENTEFLMQMKNFLIEKNEENFDRLEEELENF